MNPYHDEDRQLISRCISGDRKASETLVRQLSDIVYQSVQGALLARHVPYNSQDLEDLHNTVFMQLFEEGCKKLSQYHGRNGCSLVSWIKLVTVRIVLNHLRKKGMDAIGWRNRRIPLEDLPELSSGDSEHWTSMEKAERERLLQDGLQNLSPRDRLFIKLHFENGLPVEKVATAMQISVQNIYMVKHRAIKRLKSYVMSVTE